ncbi:hypothetical protein V8F33_000504 [Rhypophila sp. PSN 637]
MMIMLMCSFIKLYSFVLFFIYLLVAYLLYRLNLYSLVCLRGLYEVVILSIYFSWLLLLNVTKYLFYSVRISSTLDTSLHA